VIPNFSAYRYEWLLVKLNLINILTWLHHHCRDAADTSSNEQAALVTKMAVFGSNMANRLQFAKDYSQFCRSDKEIKVQVINNNIEAISIPQPLAGFVLKYRLEYRN
jgi:hypothetical protein